MQQSSVNFNITNYMKSGFTLFFALLAIHATTLGQDSNLNQEQVRAIKKLINAFQSGDKAKIAEYIIYPLRREYPLKDVKNKNDFIQRFDELFDKEFITHIVKSKITDWSEVGWRGIMLDNGSMWIQDGKIGTVNMQSAKEIQILKNAIQADKNQLPQSLRNFIRPKYLILTKNYKIRIDEITEDVFRYAAWKLKDQKSEPDIIVENGVLEFDGSGGNHTITFKKDGYTYIISINVLGEADTPDATLEVLKAEKTLLTENGVIKRN